MAAEPFRHFMSASVRNDDLRLFLDLGSMPAPAGAGTLVQSFPAPH
jgi:flagellar biosynthesis protein FliP